ncbi:pseudaminic acid biosynthesis-associated methylase [Clostridium tagluense]|uniref:pseudaminic acid biosynthesis-associated methylase n=1 Tax=Clostridium tagluense TaxID=360422 RepID=UPI001C0CB795|nr:pseudaminic acid biosynthesis-associated methylase [Clostridium tagluense]MBU3126672.1 methyltransferase domain-containing protein [Clostridium tagluense]
MENNYQKSIWNGNFGKEYTERNIYSPTELDEFYLDTYGFSRTDMNLLFLDEMNKEKCRILEIGCNVGNQLRSLQEMGFKNLYGIELQNYAVERAKELTNNINIIQASADDIPFKDGFFDLVFTSGVLIHISPENVVKILEEIYRCSNKYIWGFEYYSENYSEIKYREKENILWKTDFSNLYLKRFHRLKSLKQINYKYVNNENVDSMFLLEK